MLFNELISLKSKDKLFKCMHEKILQQFLESCVLDKMLWVHKWANKMYPMFSLTCLEYLNKQIKFYGEKHQLNKHHGLEFVKSVLQSRFKQQMLPRTKMKLRILLYN